MDAQSRAKCGSGIGKSIQDMLRKQFVSHSGQRIIGVGQQVEINPERKLDRRVPEPLADRLDRGAVVKQH